MDDGTESYIIFIKKTSTKICKTWFIWHFTNQENVRPLSLLRPGLLTRRQMVLSSPLTLKLRRFFVTSHQYTSCFWRKEMDDGTESYIIFIKKISTKICKTWFIWHFTNQENVRPLSLLCPGLLTRRQMVLSSPLTLRLRRFFVTSQSPNFI